ncbi:MAG: amino acid permease, partial [Actinomycetota bacterium]|nr:amino acid permease [Actinomycetota bacterium]
FRTVHPSRRTPLASIVFVALMAFVLVTTANVELLGSQTAALLLAVFALVNICVLVLRKEPVDHEHFVAPTALPVIASISCLILLAKQPLNVLTRALILLLVGVVLFVVNRFVSGKAETVEAEELT